MPSLWKHGLEGFDASKNPLASVARGRHELTQVMVEVVAVKATLEAFDVEFNVFSFRNHINNIAQESEKVKFYFTFFLSFFIS